MHTFDLNVGQISKIEGEATLVVRVKDDKIEECRFSITEFKRFYTKALQGKDVLGLPQLCCRICGTCSNAHLLCAIKAAENTLGITPSVQTELLRKLVYYGLIIRDHGLHCYVFALPDLFGIDNILELDEKDPQQHQILHDTFEVKAAGNLLGTAIGGRSVHAPYPLIGGFSKLPDPKQFPEIIQKLEQARPAVMRLISLFTKSSDYLIRETEYIALLDDEFSFLNGSIYESDGRNFHEKDYPGFLEHVVAEHSHASAYRYKGKVAMTGALARINLGKSKLHPKTQVDAAEALKQFPSKNIYHNNLAQAIEILHAIDRSLDILKTITITEEKPIPVQKKAGVGIGVIEAPRGLLFYKLTLDDKGVITDIQIVVPTGQNQLAISESLRDHMQMNLAKDKDALSLDAERIVRAYDPCMSCASHFLKVKWLQG